VPVPRRIPPGKGDQLRTRAAHRNAGFGGLENIQLRTISVDYPGCGHACDESRFLARVQILPPYLPVRRADQLLTRMNALRIRAEDLVESFSRSSGPGGQNVNKVSSAATIRHIPSGLTVTASDNRSQAINRQLALERLLTALEARRANEHHARLAAASKLRRQRARRSRATKARLVEEKRLRARTKRLRGKVAL
jgi:peptide chain release factor